MPNLDCWSNALKALSREGRDISLYLSSPRFSQEGESLDTLILGTFHGDEPEARLLATRFLAETAPISLNGRRVGVVPMVNPDGFERKNRVNAAGVDLNRNFPTEDWEELNAGTPYYSGPSPASEPETEFILKLLALFSPQKIITLHTPYRLINYDGPARELANAMADINGYPIAEDIGYATPGSFGTYTGKERGIPTITLELPEEGFDEEAIRQNILALQAAIHWPI